MRGGRRPKAGATWLLLAGDLLALFLFVLAGQWEHRLVGPTWLWPAVRSTLPFALVWLVVSAILRLYSPAAMADWLPLVGRALHAWLLAAPLALLVRALWLGRATIPTLFLAATLGFGALFLTGWRLLFSLVSRRRERNAAGDGSAE